MTLQKKLESFAGLLGTLGPNVYHYFRKLSSFPCIVWQEEQGNGFGADNAMAEQGASGTLDYFTRTEFDPMVDAIQALLNDNGIAWEWISTQYEEATGLIHWEWTWEVA